MYKNYIFDLYGTLIDIRTNENKPYLWEKLAMIYSFKGANYSKKEIKQKYLELCSEYTKRCKFDYPDIKIEYVFKDLFEYKGVKVSLEQAISVAQYFRVLSTKYIKLYDGVIELLDTLKKKNKKIYLLSNAQQIYTEYEMKMVGIYDYFDGIIFSSDEECSKPDSNFYNTILKRYNLDKKQSIMIGNDYITDIEGSYNVGLDSLYIHSNISPEIKGKLLAKYKVMDGDVKKIINMII